MLAIVGLVVVFASVIGGYVLHHGQLMVLYQPTEYLIIVGAALGILLVSQPIPVLKKLIGQTLGILGSGGPSRKDYKELLVMMYEFFVLSKQSGLMGLESHFEEPKNSAILQRYPRFMKNHLAFDFMRIR